MIKQTHGYRMGFILLAWFLAGTSTWAQGSREQELSLAQAARVDAAVQKEMERQGLVGVAIGVLQKGEVVYLKGYGLSDREKKTPVTTASVFNWASNSKPLAAVAAMQLVEKKLLDLDTDVRRYVPEFPAKEHPITMRHLLSHQSGIQHYGKVIPTIRTYNSKYAHLDPVLALDVFNRTPLSYKPGEKVVYSSYAHVLASATIQGAGKEPFSKQVENRIIKPLDLKSLQYDLDHLGQLHWATGYTRLNNKVVPAPEVAHYWKHGAGGFKSNISDFARWAHALINRQLVRPETEKQMWTRQKTSDGKLTSWGLGFSIDEQGGLRVSHGGKQEETTTRLVIYPERKHGIVVMTNCGFGDPAAVSTAIYQALAEK